MDIDKYLGNGIEIQIGDEKLKLPQLGIEYQKHKFKVFRAVSKAFKNYSQADLNDESKQAEIFSSMFEQFDDVTVDSAGKLVEDTTKRLFPNADQNQVNMFVNGNFFVILMAIISELKGDTGSTNAYDRIQNLKEKANENNGKSSE